MKKKNMLAPTFQKNVPLKSIRAWMILIMMGICDFSSKVILSYIVIAGLFLDSFAQNHLCSNTGTIPVPT